MTTRAENVLKYCDGTRTINHVKILTGETEAYIRHVIEVSRRTGAYAGLKRQYRGQEISYVRLMALADGNMTRQQVKEAIGMTDEGFKKALSSARAQGFRPIFSDSFCAPKISNITALISTEARAWLQSQLHDGYTMTDLIADIIEDAFLENQAKLAERAA